VRPLQGYEAAAARVVAVEPSVSTFKRLERNTRGRNIVPARALIGRSGEERVFLDNTVDPNCSTSLLPGQSALEGHAYLKPTNLATESLDDLVSDGQCAGHRERQGAGDARIDGGGLGHRRTFPLIPDIDRVILPWNASVHA
jgi:hypothetical protein